MSRRRLLAWLAAAGAAAALVAQTGRAVDRIGASKRLRVVQTVSSRMASLGQSPPELIVGDFRLLREAERLDPSLVETRVAAAGQYMLTGQYDLAVEGYERALAFEPRAEVYFDLGRALSGAGRDEEARQAFDKAVALDPALWRQVPRGERPPRPRP